MIGGTISQYHTENEALQKNVKNIVPSFSYRASTFWEPGKEYAKIREIYVNETSIDKFIYYNYMEEIEDVRTDSMNLKILNSKIFF